MLVAAIWIWPAILNVVDRLVQGRLQGWDPARPAELLFTAGDWLIYALVTPLVFWISRRWPVVRPHVSRRLALHMAWALLFCVVWAIGGKLFQLALASTLESEALRSGIANAGPALGRMVAVNVASWILTTLPFGVVVYATVAGMAHAADYFTEAREREVQVARLGEQLAGARYAALQAQLNPHFLFNTLNTVTVLVRDGDRDGAVEIVERLSDLLRRTLARDRANEVPLDEELDLVRQYLAIEEARFSDRLRAEVTTQPSVGGVAIPGFAIQHLVENAVRHGIARSPESGKITVDARREGADFVVRVTDDGAGIGAVVPPPGHGIEATRERIRVLYGEATQASLTVEAGPGGGTIATLRVPYREFSPQRHGESRTGDEAD